MALTKITSDVIETGAITSDKLASGAVSASSLSSITTDNVSEGSTNTYFTNARARGSVSVTGGNLSYDSGTGVIQLTTDQIRTAVSGGTGVSISAGEISIGQDVATSSTPTFGNITTTGYIAGPATFTIDPAAIGDNTGTVVIAGNLQVDGTTTTINSTTMEVDDLNITLASGAANAAAANGAGITVDGASATITYDGTNDEWDFNKDINVTGTITSSGNITGTLATAAQPNITSLGTLTGLTTSGDINFGDNDKAVFGAGSDLQIYHDGSNSYIVDGNSGSDLLIRSNNIVLENTSGHNMIHMASGGAVQLYHNNVSKVKTTATGAQIGLNDSTITRLQLYGATSAEHQIKFGNDGTNGEKDGAIRYFGEAHSTTANRRAMTFSTAQTERMRIDSSGKVHIGATSGTGLLNVDGGAGEGSLYVEGTSSGSPITARLLASDGGAVFFGSNTNHDLRIQTNGTNRMTINSSGNVGIGLPSGSPDAKLTVSGSANSEQVIITGNGNQSRGLSILTAATGGQQDATVIFNAQDTENVAYPAMKFQTGGGDILRFHHQSIINNARVGLAYPCELMFNGEYTAGQQDVALEAGHAARIEFLKDDFFRIQGSPSVSAGAGVSYTDKLKVNIDSGGILFGSDTAAANTLDDYEEGTFDPSLTTESGSVTAYSSYNTLAYTKVGRVVTITGLLALQSVSSPSGIFTFGNLPFAMASLANRAGRTMPTITLFASGSGAPTQNKYYPAFINFGDNATQGTVFAMYDSTHDGTIGDWLAAGSDLAVNFSYVTN